MALCVEALDELVDGTKGAALPLIRASLHLRYAQVGLLLAVPVLAGSLIELPVGLIAGYGRGRSRLVLAGGMAFAVSLTMVAFARTFAVLLAGLAIFFPASGAFVALTAAALMDRDPDRRQRHMAAWNLAGAAGAVAGPLLLAVLLTAGCTWRSAYLLLAALAAAAVPLAAVAGPARPRLAAGAAAGRDAGESVAAGPAATFRTALRAARDARVRRWLTLLQVSDLLLDVLTGYIGVYLVDVAHLSSAVAAVGVAIRLGAMLAGGGIFVLIAPRVNAAAALRATAIAAGLLYPAFLLLPGAWAKLAVLAALSIATACWYPVASAGLYASLPGRSGAAVFLSSAAGMAGAAGPLVVGVISQRAGLSLALACLAITPVAVLILSPGRPRAARLSVR